MTTTKIEERTPLLDLSISVPPQPGQGLTVVTASIFIVAEIAGSGLITLPKAMEDTGWSGVAVLFVSYVLSTFTGVILSKDWNILISRHSEYAQNTRRPYPALGQITYGRPGRILVSFCIIFTLFGGCVVFLLLTGNIFSRLVIRLGANISICDAILIFGGVLIPISWLGTPKDFWPAALVATLATFTSLVLLLMLIANDITPERMARVRHDTPTLLSFFTAFGTFVYSFGGHSVFLTIQSDMRTSTDFSKALIIGFSVTCLIYLPVAVMGFMAYGNLLDSNVLANISNSTSLDILQVTILIHILLAFIIIVNPICLELESFLQISPQFNWKRCVIRTLLLLCIVFVAETIPNFGSILSFIGGSTITMLSFIFPSLFYLKLMKQNQSGNAVPLSVYEKGLHVTVVILGFLLALLSTYSSLRQLVTENFVPPCFVQRLWP